MTGYTIGKLAQVIHVTDNLAGADLLYREAFSAECFYQGYSPSEMRDASLLAIGEFVIEPMAPGTQVGADEMPVGRFLGRFGPHLHSIALNVTGIPDLYAHLRSHNIRVVGPGGSDPTQAFDAAIKSVYTHPKDTHCLIEFVDFGDELMEGNPRLNADWSDAPWQVPPLGFVRTSHVTVVVRDLGTATHFFSGILGCSVFLETDRSTTGARSRFLLLGTETVLELAQPTDPASTAAADLNANGEIVHAVTLRVLDTDSTTEHLATHGIRVAERGTDHVALNPADMYGARFRLTDKDLAGDPRLRLEG